jgi:carboxymethylenebutenolidase
MAETEISVGTPDGTMSTLRIGDQSDPAVIVLMAAHGRNEGLLDVGRRLADHGYCALVPDLFYRWGENLLYDPATELDQMVETLNKLTDPMVVSDVGALLDSLEAGPVGTMGFCMGGRFVVRSMAAYPDRIVAGSALHPSHLYLDGNPDSPHFDIARITGEIYFGFGAVDPIVPSENWDAVREEVKRHGTRARIDIHPDAEHGFMLPGLWYQAAAAEACWQATFEVLRGLRESVNMR